MTIDTAAVPRPDRRFSPALTRWMPRLRSEAAFAVLGSLLAIGYAVRVPRWLPYDEPAHWANVIFVAEHLRMPILGEPGSSYESQMGPVAYFFDAFWLKLWLIGGGSVDGGFVLVRLAGLIPLLGFFLLLRRAVSRSVPSLPESAVTGAAALVSFNPMFLAMAMSVQNDVLALLLGLAALYRCLAGTTPTVREATVVGVLGGFAVLTKLTAWPVLPVVAVVWLRRYGIGSVKAVTVLTLTGTVVCGWWFAVNVARYGDPTARRGVEAMGFVWGPAPFEGWPTVVFLVKSLAAYLLLPVEYWRNLVSAPWWVEGAVGVLLLVVLLQSARRWHRSAAGPGRSMLMLVSTVSFGVWTLLFFTVQGSPVRFAYLALSAWCICVAVAFTSTWAHHLAWVCISVLHLWALVEVGGVHYP